MSKTHPIHLILSLALLSLLLLCAGVKANAINSTSASLEKSFEHLEKLSAKNPQLALNAATQLLAEQETQLSTEDKTTLLAKIAQYYYFVADDEQSLAMVNKAYLLNPDLSSDTGISLLLTHALLLTHQNAVDEAKQLYFQAEQNAILTENNKRLAETYGYIASFYTFLYNDVEAIKYYHKSYVLLQQQNNELAVMYLKAQLANSYANIYDYDKSISLGQEALSYFMSHELYFDALSAENQLARTYLAIEQYQQAKLSYNKMLALSEHANNNTVMGIAYLGLAQVYFGLNDLPNARVYIEKFHKIKTPEVSPYTALSYLKIDANLELAAGNISLAEEKVAQMDEIITSLANDTALLWQLSTLSLKAHISFQKQDYKSAYQFEKSARELSDSYYNTQRESMRSKYKVLFDTDQANLKNKLLERDKLLDKAALKSAEQQRSIQYLVSSFALIFIIFLTYLFKKQIKRSDTLNKLANTDMLTGLANRRFIFQYAETTLSLAQNQHYPLAVIVFDVDHFKSVNDTYGHTGGDYALIGISKIANEFVRAQDVLGRIGGEEFLLVLPKTSALEASAVANRIRQAIEDKDFMINELKVTITSSFGVAEYNNIDESFSELFQRADEALYTAKERGRNLVVLANE